MSAGFASVRNAIRADFNTWFAGALGWPVQYENAPPADADNVKWAHFSIKFDDGALIEVGGPKTFRHGAVMYVMLFAPETLGSGDADAAADLICNRYRAVQMLDATFETPSVVDATRVGRHWRTTVRVPFRFNFSVSSGGGVPVGGP